MHPTHNVLRSTHNVLHRGRLRLRGFDQALEEIRAGRGRVYDAEAVDACLALLDEGFSFEEPPRQAPGAPSEDIA